MSASQGVHVILFSPVFGLATGNTCPVGFYDPRLFSLLTADDWKYTTDTMEENILIFWMTRVLLGSGTFKFDFAGPGTCA